MVLIDVNVLLYAYVEDLPEHAPYATWLSAVANGDQAFGLSEFVLSGFLRIVTHPRILKKPASLDAALKFIELLRTRPNCVLIHPSSRHWEIFTRLCREAGARGNLVPDAYYAALAIESGSEWITADRDFARFPGLQWRVPV